MNLYFRIILSLVLLASISSRTKATGIPKVHHVVTRVLPLIGVEGRDTIRLECIASGDPLPTLHWTFNGTTIESGEKYRIEKDNSVLRVFDAKVYSDSGVYRCFATNVYGSVFGQTRISVPSLGRFETGFKVDDSGKEISVTIGKPLSIPCPPHIEGLGQIYLWGDLPAHETPTFWRPGSPVERAFIGRHGELSFAYLEFDDIEKINKMGGISCILYQDGFSVQGVRYRLKGSEFSTLNIPPKLITFMDVSSNVVGGKKGSILCGAEGRPQPEISWYKDNVLIYDGRTKQTVGENITVTGVGMQLNINPLTRSAEGVYKCVAQNTEGKDEKEGKIIVHSSPKWQTQLRENVDVLVEDSIHLSCVSHGYPAVTYTWYHNGSIITNNASYKITDGDLLIDVSDFSDTGIYMCVASNYLDTIVSASFVLVKAVPPKFLTSLPSLSYFFNNHPNSLYCNATARPQPSKTWFFDGKKITSNNHYTVHLNGTLMVRNSSNKDAGQYKCIATNAKGSVESTGIIKVVDKTVIVKPPATLTYLEYTARVQMFCDATYEKSLPVSFEWLKDGTPLQFNDRVTKERRITGPSRIVFIESLRLSDAGVYGCRVFTSNESEVVSEDVKYGELKVVAKPNSPSEIWFNGVCSSNSELHWQTPKFFGASIKSYIVEYASASSPDTWATFVKDQVNTTVELNLQTLPPSVDLIFRIKSVAMYNGEMLISEASTSTWRGACITPIGRPVTNPVNVRSERDKETGKLRILWDQTDNIHQTSSDYKLIVGYRQFNTSGNFTELVLTPGKTSMEIPDSKPNESYEVFVRTRNTQGLGPEPQIFILGGETPIATVDTLKIDFITPNAIGLSWDPVATATGYRIYYWFDMTSRKRRKVDGRFFTDVLAVYTYNITALQPDQAYVVTIAAKNINGIGPESKQLTFRTKISELNAPTNVNLQLLGNTLKLSWKPPVSGTLTSYTLRWYKADDLSSVKTLTLDKSAKQAFITEGLEEFTYYTVELVPNSEEGEGERWSISGVVVGGNDKPGRPGQPVSSPYNNSALNVTFVLPTTYYGGLPDFFTVYYKVQGSTNHKYENQTYPLASWLTISNLNFEVSYEIWSTATNKLGEGESSEVVIASLPRVVAKEEDKSPPFYTRLWFIILVICIVLLIIFILITYCYCSKCFGGRYKVDEKERQSGGWSDNEPLKNYSEIPLEESNPSPIPKKSNGEPIRSVSQNSLYKPPPYKSTEEANDDKDSLDEYGEELNFNEDGSFIGQYGDEEKKALHV